MKEIAQVRDSIHRSLWQHGFLLLTFGLSLVLLPAAQAVSPPPDGGYANQNTAEGDNALLNLTDGTDNTAAGYGALSSNTTGGANTASGSYALFSNTTGTFNTAIGQAALLNNTTGFNNTATASGALFSNTTGSANTATGYAALFSNTSGLQNTAIGYDALYLNTTGNYNTANGYAALSSNTTGSYNTADGFQALFRNTTGLDNTAFGTQALFSNTTGSLNTANGLNALFSNTTGGNDTATGYLALTNNTTGSNNLADGYQALLSNTTGSNNTAEGFQSLLRNTRGSSNVALGASAGANLTIGSNNIDIGNAGVAGEASKIRIGTKGTHKQVFIAGIQGNTIPGGVGVIIDSQGHLGTVTSSARFKDEIKAMDKASEAILALQPVTFRYKPDLDPNAIPQFGLVAEQVEKINPDLVARDEQGRPYTVRYEAVNAMLLNEFLKEHRKVAEQDCRLTQALSAIARQNQVIAQQQKQIEALTTGLRKVGDERQLRKAVPQLVSADK